MMKHIILPDVGFGELASAGPTEERLVAEDPLHSVKRSKERNDILFVRLLGLREAGLVHAIVNLMID